MPRQFVPVSAPGPLEIREKEHTAVRQNLPGEEMNQQPVEREEFPERSLVLAQQGFPQCSQSSHLQQSVPDGLDFTQAQETLHREETTCGAKVSTAVLENCVFTKSVMSKLSSVVSVVMVLAGGNC